MRGGGGHVESPVADQQVGVVHGLEGGEVVLCKKAVVGSPRTVDAGGAVRLVRDGQIEGRRAVPPLGQRHLLQRLVGAEDHPGPLRGGRARRQSPPGPW